MEPTAPKKYDLVVFGATGFTGQFLVDEVARVAEEENMTWAVAGRNMAKLQKVLSEASSRVGKDLQETPIIIADVSVDSSLQEMASQARVILNVSGPYTNYGEPVIKACIEHGTHHLDLSGEQEFIEKMQLLYHAKAKENNTFVIEAAGTGCLGSEAGVMFMQDKFKHGKLTSVEAFLNVEFGPLGGGLNHGTFESLIISLGRSRELKEIRRVLFSEPLAAVEHKLPKRSCVFYSEEANKWCAPTISVDKSIVERTVQDHLKTGVMKAPIDFLMHLCQPNLLLACGLSIFTCFLLFFSKFSLGRWLLLKVFKNVKGPSREQVKGTSFTMTYKGQGFDSAESASANGKPNRQVIAKMRGPEPFYIATCINLVQCGVTLLKAGSQMHHKGGVLTTGAAFFGTSILQRLEKHNIKITTISDTAKPEN